MSEQPSLIIGRPIRQGDTPDVNLTLYVPQTLIAEPVTIRVKGTRDDPLINVPDTCRFLGMTGVNAVRNTIERLGPGRVTFHSDGVKTPTGGRPSTYEDAYVHEPDFYKIVLTSRAKNADAAEAAEGGQTRTGGPTMNTVGAEHDEADAVLRTIRARIEVGKRHQQSRRSRVAVLEAVLGVAMDQHKRGDVLLFQVDQVLDRLTQQWTT